VTIAILFCAIVHNMLFDRIKYSVLFRVIALTISLLFLVQSQSYNFDLLSKDSLACSTLAVGSAKARGVDRDLRAMAYRELFEERLAPSYGGKGSWDKVLEDLAPKIGFHTALSSRFTIQEVWDRFIEANKALVDEGNALIDSELREHRAISSDAEERLRAIAAEFQFPKEIESYIRNCTEMLKGWVIARSSGRHEDSFLRNLAGIFISPKKKDERLIVQGIKEIFDHAVRKIWIEQNTSTKKTEGIPNLLNTEEGFGVVVQPFLSFDASGTAMSNLYGHTAIEAVIGDADMAVRPVHANATQFLFKKGQNNTFEYNPTFLSTPYEFRLKGKEYSVERNLEEMSEIMKKYPKIEGRFSPLNNEQAIELNRVVNALEEEIGVPLDVEWGLLNKKLYIIQIRPIIGDFKKPLVEMSPELQGGGKQAIAQTPIALGHTEPIGFTGKMVVVGNNVPRDIIQQFEDEFSKNYIRVQSDVASHVLECTTRAKILVDPEQGSRQAHNINLITNRISAGEFVYCNGPILKNYLLQSLDFVPHPELKGIWVSDQEVTYFANGLKGVFYKSVTKAEPLKQSDDYSRQAALIDFHNKVKDTWFQDDIGMPEHSWILETMRVFRFGAYFGRSIQEMFVDMRHEENCNLDFVQRKLLAFEYQESDFETIQYELGLLEEALSFPLYPSRWESSRMRAFRNILFLKGISEKLKEKQPKQKTTIPQQYVVLLLDPYDVKKPAETQLEKTIGDAQVIRVGSKELLLRGDGKTKILPDKLSAIKTAGAISAICIHLNYYYDFPSLFAVLTRIRQENADSLIIVEGNTLSRDEFKRFESKYGRVILKTDGVFEDQEIAKFIQEDHLKWAERRKAAQQSRDKKPEEPEKVNVLFVIDETNGAKIAVRWFNEIPEANVKHCFNVNDALEYLKENRVHVIISDYNIPMADEESEDTTYSSSNIAILLDAAEKAAKERNHPISLAVFTAWFEESQKEALEERFNTVRTFRATESGMYPKFQAIIKETYQKIVENYHRVLAGWRAQHEKPEKPEKFKILMIEDSKPYLETFKVAISQLLANDEYELVTACENEEVIDLLKSGEFDMAIVDIEFHGALDFRIKTLLGQVPHVIAFSGNEIDVVRRDVNRDFDHPLAERIHAVEKKNIQLDTEKIVGLARDWREKKLKAAEQAAPKLRILIANDDGEWRESMSEYLANTLGLSEVAKLHYSEDNYEIVFVKDEAGAIEYLDSHEVNYAVIDWKLPGEDTTGPFPVFDRLRDKGVRTVDIQTASPSYAEYHRQTEERYPEFTVSVWPFEPHEIVDHIKEVRQQQLQAWEERRKATAQEATERLGATLPFRVLLIEDDGAIVMPIALYWQETLLKSEYELVRASNAKKAIEILRKGGFDAVIYDCRFPGFDNELKRLLSDVPNLIVQTAASHKEARDILGDDLLERSLYIMKPFELEGLIAMVKEFREKKLRAEPQTISSESILVPLKVLYVNDDLSAVQDRMEKFFSKFDNIEVHYARDSFTAHVILQDECPDVVICDMRLRSDIDDAGDTEEIFSYARFYANKAGKDVTLIGFSAFFGWISKQEVIDHVGSEVEFYSTMDGEKFFANVEMKLKEAFEKRAIVQRAQAAGFEKLRVLYVEDSDFEAQQFMRDIAPRFGHAEFVIAQDRESAKRLIREENFDLVMCDFRLDSDGEQSVFSVFNEAFRRSVRLKCNIGLAIISLVPNNVDASYYVRNYGERFVGSWDKEEMPQKLDSALKNMYEQRLKALEASKRENAPAKLNILVVEDEKIQRECLDMYWSDNLPREEYNWTIVGSCTEALELMDKNNFDLVIYDVFLSDFVDTFKTRLLAVPHLMINSGATDVEAVKERTGPELFARSDCLYKEIGWWEGRDFNSAVKAVRQKQLEAWEEIHKAAVPKPKDRPSIFVLDNSGNDAKRLSFFLNGYIGATYDISHYDMMYTLRIAIEGGLVPDVVIMNTALKAEGSEENVDMNRIIEFLKTHNPNVKIIITNEEAETLREEIEDENILGVVEKPFHFHDVLDILSGTYDHKTTLARERFKIEEVGRIVKGIEEARTKPKPDVIRAWSGYAKNIDQKALLQELRQEMSNYGYDVAFGNITDEDASIKELVDFAISEAGKQDNAVTILPSNHPYVEAHMSELKEANVIFMDYDMDSVSPSTFFQISGIIASGIAYINNSDLAMMNLYKLLTDDNNHAAITVDELRRNPSCLIFMLKPIEVEDADEIRKLNERMKALLIAA